MNTHTYNTILEYSRNCLAARVVEPRDEERTTQNEADKEPRVWILPVGMAMFCFKNYFIFIMCALMCLCKCTPYVYPEEVFRSSEDIGNCELPSMSGGKREEPSCLYIKIKSHLIVKTNQGHSYL